MVVSENQIVCDTGAVLLPVDLLLHKGEMEAINLAKELNLGLLIEDADGKEFAKNHNIPVSGIAGQILKALKNKVIEKTLAMTLLNEMHQKHRLNLILQLLKHH